MSSKITSLVGIWALFSEPALALAVCTSSTNPSTQISIERQERACAAVEEVNATDELFCAQLKLKTLGDDMVSISSYDAQCLGYVSDPKKGYFSCSGFNGTWATLTITVSSNKSYGAALITRSDNIVSVVSDRGSCIEED